MRHETGIFSDHANGLKYIALSRAPKASGKTASEIMDAVSRGLLPVYEVSGCKAVTLSDLVAFTKGAE